MEEVKGLRVIPVRNPAIPQRTSKLVAVSERWAIFAITAPILAPAVNYGANISPAAPVEKETIGPIILRRGICQSSCLFSEKRRGSLF